MKKRRSIKASWILVIIAAIVGIERFAVEFRGSRDAAATASGDTLIEEAFAARRSGCVVEFAGRVMASLPDDQDGSRHQRFVVQLESGHTVLVAHNIDLADRVPVTMDDPVHIRGQYEWNDRGGVIHWTHLDPQNRRPGGWIEHRGRRFR